MEQHEHKDVSKEIKAAEEYKQKLGEAIKVDPIKRKLRNFLNLLTKDNYEEVKKDILEIIKDNVEFQIKFLDVLFHTVYLESIFVKLYAKLCKELDKELPQISQNRKIRRPTSVMREKLLDKCKEAFTIQHNEEFDEFIMIKDPEERKIKLKYFLLGIVKFIAELIDINLLSKKTGPSFIKNLFEKYEQQNNDKKLKLIYIEAIILFTEKFGTLIHYQEKRVVLKDAMEYKGKIDEILKKLDIIKDEKGLPGHIKYLIINLIEKKKIITKNLK